MEWVGRVCLRNLNSFVEFWRFLFSSFKEARRHLPDRGVKETFSVLLNQIYFTGVEALPLISLLAITTGVLVVIQSVEQLSRFGGSSFQGNMVVAVVIRELAPLLTALIVAARSGTAVAVELGTMRAHGEMALLESMGIQPMSFMIFPRVVGGTVALCALTVWFAVIAVVGGFTVAGFFVPLDKNFLFSSVLLALARSDAILFFLKALVSGLTIFTVASLQGLKVKYSFTEVPRVCTRAMVFSLGMVVFFDGALSLGIYFEKLKQLGIL